jgi:hypothetical protein
VWHEELDELRCLIQIFLLGDVIETAVTIGRGITLRGFHSQIQNRSEGGWSNVERNEPNREYLGHVHIKLELFLVKSYIDVRFFTLLSLSQGGIPIEWTSNSIRGDIILYH